MSENTTKARVYEVTVTLMPDDNSEVTKKYNFNKPEMASYDRYIKSAASSPTRALRTFVSDNIVPEDAARLAADFEEFPALALGIGEKLLNMLGLAKEVNLIKL